ncbi:tyrosine-type recombinase/integrase [Streptococcus rupicaprae]|uniref:tyrosine-type recombinase/integrase n=1 Tax=Streptococcus rupicaprae TaxID=759619 RepID=UPI00339284E8
MYCNRHTFASVMLAQGIDIWALSKIMGHKNITQITETYGHLMKEKADSESNKIRDFLSELK